MIEIPRLLKQSMKLIMVTKTGAGESKVVVMMTCTTDSGGFQAEIHPLSPIHLCHGMMLFYLSILGRFLSRVLGIFYWLVCFYRFDGIQEQTLNDLIKLNHQT